MKEVFYFQHDYNARNDPKLQDVLIEHGVGGIGVFWCIIEQMYEQDGFLPLKSCKSIAFALHIDCNLVESVVLDFGLFQNDGTNFWSNSVKSRLDKRKEVKEARKNAALKRWESIRKMQMQSKGDANAIQDISKEKERKGKESKVNNTISNDIEMEKAKSAKRFRSPTLQEVQNYISEKGYSIDAEAFIAFYESKGWMVGKNKMKDWRMAIVTWSKRDNERRPARKSVTKNCNDEWT
ncbi:Lin1244/Lin1753 domain-containing protein [Prevotella sp.]|uniref:Lin1244/Lin1753 domain-containing protein n=1 Tax=Prevotella sp. TaxID=59823 RepID=UPI002F950E00